MNRVNDHGRGNCAENGAEFVEKYEIERCADWIKKNHYRRICLQFPDELLGDAVGVQRQLGIRTEARLFVSADATFRSCCLDMKTAKHVDADALIHFGRTCSSRFYSNSTATLLVLPKEFLNVDALIDCVTLLVEQKRCNVVLLYDIAFAHYADRLDARLRAFRRTVSVSRLLSATADDDVEHDRCELGRKDDESETASIEAAASGSKNVVERFGRRYRVDFDDNERNVAYVYVTSTSSRKNFENFLFSSPDSTFYSYEAAADILSEEGVPKSIKKTLFRVEKVKEARRIGILVATLEARSFLDAVRRIKKLCAAKRKKAYVISVGKLNVAKLANFPEIDLFVMISCPEVEILDRKDYFQTIVSAMEVELALNDNHRWSGKFVADFSEFLPDGSEYKPVDENGVGPDVSLLNNRLMGFDDYADANDADVNATETVATGGGGGGGRVLSVDNSSARYDLANRSWVGLQTRLDHDAPAVSAATVGRKGTPAAGYETPFSDHIT